MPFGLTNAPQIFQRAMDDRIREQFGKFCHVYMDDIIIFSHSLKHFIDLNSNINILHKVNMKISLEKSQFFKLETTFLGYVVEQNIIKTDLQKIDTISNYPVPKNIRERRRFLGLSGYYRKFVKNYATIAKPLTRLLEGSNGKIFKRMSKNVSITLNKTAKQATQNT